MARFIRRLLLLALLGASVAAAVKALRARRAPSMALDSGPAWPPMESPDPPPSTEGLVLAPDPRPGHAAARSAWVAPVDGGCPSGYPIKANDSSHIYHVPGGQFYDRTVPERCYVDAAAAEADGYRAARR